MVGAFATGRDVKLSSAELSACVVVLASRALTSQLWVISHTQVYIKTIYMLIIVPAHFYGYEQKSVKIYDMTISQAEGIYSTKLTI